MSLPRFLDRVVDAAAPALGGLDRAEVRRKLEHSSVTLSAGKLEPGEPAEAAFVFAANLAARLYPTIRLLGPEGAVRRATEEIALINPAAVVEPNSDADSLAVLAFELGDGAGESAVSVFARGWNIYLDEPPSTDDESPAPLAALQAATLGMSELFRVVFADDLGGRGRHRPQPGSFNLLSLGEPTDLPSPARVELGAFRLVGAGAIGQATAHALGCSGAQGRMIAIDPEEVALSNLQRYVLGRDQDVGRGKTELLRDRLSASRLEVEPIRGRWEAHLATEPLPTLVALDSAAARIEVQASLPGPIYNAWTQPHDVGWSRHERFGEEPCLACLYWPDHRAPNRYEQIAQAFGQHPLRVLAYLVRHLPIGLPLPADGIPAMPDLPAPPDAEHWLKTSIADDITKAAALTVDDLAAWHNRTLADVYQEGICGGALLDLSIGEAPREVLVPLPHQSAFAGVMLAAQFLAASESLVDAVDRPIEGRYDVLRGLPQVLARPRNRARSCICADPVFVDVYREKSGVATDGPRTTTARSKVPTHERA